MAAHKNNENNECNTFETFLRSMKSKFDKKIKEGRSKEPWAVYSNEFLIEHMLNEVTEFLDEYHKGHCDDEELIDIALFSMFLWVKMRKETAEADMEQQADCEQDARACRDAAQKEWIEENANYELQED